MDAIRRANTLSDEQLEELLDELGIHFHTSPDRFSALGALEETEPQHVLQALVDRSK